MPQHRGSGTLAELNSPYTSLDQVPIMANYHPPYDSTLNHQGENNAAAQSGASCHSAQDIQGAMDDTLAHAQPAKTPAVNEAGEDMG